MRNGASDQRHIIGERQVRPRRRRLGVLGLAACLVLVYGVIVLTGPWAAHIGNRWTPMLTWTGTGKLITDSGTYPIYVSLFPSSHSSRLRLDGLRPTGGVRGWGSLCTSRSTVVPLELSGTIYGGWKTTD